MLFAVDICKVIEEQIAGSAAKIKKEQRRNDPERCVFINIHILIFLQEMIEIRNADDEDAQRGNTVTLYAVPVEMVGDAFEDIERHK